VPYRVLYTSAICSPFIFVYADQAGLQYQILIVQANAKLMGYIRHVVNRQMGIRCGKNRQ